MDGLGAVGISQRTGIHSSSAASGPDLKMLSPMPVARAHWLRHRSSIALADELRPIAAQPRSAFAQTLAYTPLQCASQARHRSLLSLRLGRPDALRCQR